MKKLKDIIKIEKIEDFFELDPGQEVTVNCRKEIYAGMEGFSSDPTSSQYPVTIKKSEKDFSLIKKKYLSLWNFDCKILNKFDIEYSWYKKLLENEK